MAVSSAKVLRIVVSDCGISAAYIVYNNGPKMLPWGTPERIGNGGEVSLLYVVTKYLFCKNTCVLDLCVVAIDQVSSFVRPSSFIISMYYGKS